jgi:NitT/TauT family transport system ATP-binding protein
MSHLGRWMLSPEEISKTSCFESGWNSRRQLCSLLTASKESVYLADRVVVMTFRPGRIKTVLPVALARPRQPNSPEFNGVEQELTRLVMEEQLQHLRDETLGGGG